MTQFSSGKHADVITRTGLPMHRPLANPANPILENYRGNEGHWPIDGYLRSLSLHNSWQWESIARQDEIEHARAVILRLVKFIEGES
ncbi:hypothetical protein SAMN05428970_1983 [Agromyces sp. CF514]|uniref:hypothetical protein n=1 Tax=Agromyces sp. CF514 TaxID=1881031 RepID=UPI0008EDAC83|nr:hypothetical protein [Agromyces sp. CF514]SFR75874.1 hypothetical protein SAMN05428970_1983 [Agromyces sp. CF514]